jgi:hypothetical protein
MEGAVNLNYGLPQFANAAAMLASMTAVRTRGVVTGGEAEPWPCVTDRRKEHSQ